MQWGRCRVILMGVTRYSTACLEDYWRDPAAPDWHSGVTTSDENIDAVVEAEMAGLDAEYAALCAEYAVALA